MPSVHAGPAFSAAAFASGALLVEHSAIFLNTLSDLQKDQERLKTPHKKKAGRKGGERRGRRISARPSIAINHIVKMILEIPFTPALYSPAEVDAIRISLIWPVEKSYFFDRNRASWANTPQSMRFIGRPGPPGLHRRVH
jgi:hypothetical protein